MRWIFPYRNASYTAGDNPLKSARTWKITRASSIIYLPKQPTFQLTFKNNSIMQTNNIVAGGNTSDLLSAIYKVEIRNEDKISEQDRIYCQSQQDELYKSLDQIDLWYKTFTEEVQQYKESHRIRYKDNGKVEFCDSYRPYEEQLLDYKEMEFRPFKNINEIVDSNYRANEAFANRIVRYFNKTYNVSVPMPEINKETLEMGFRPLYQSYVDTVIEHLGGRSFRDTAEEELLKRFLGLVTPGRWSKVKPELKGDKISFPNILTFDSFYQENYNRNQIHYSYRSHIETFCEGIAFGSDDTVNGSSQMISGFNENNVDISGWYDLTTSNAEQMKFFKNGRIDVRFKDRETAQSCYKRLRLDEITLREDTY